MQNYYSELTYFSTNLNRPFVVNRMRDYLPFVNHLLASPHRRPVDHRIAAYIEGFAIAGLFMQSPTSSNCTVDGLQPM